MNIPIIILLERGFDGSNGFERIVLTSKQKASVMVN